MAETRATHGQAEEAHPWLTSYPEGVPAEIDPESYASVADFFVDNCRRFADRPAYSNMGTRLTYGEIEQRSRRFAAYLRHELGLEKGERVAIMMPNLLQYPIALFGVLRAGLVAVNTNPLYTARELKHQLADSGAKAIVVLENFAHVLARVRESTEVEHIVVTGAGDQLGLPKSVLVNTVARYVKRMVPAYELTGTVRFNHALALGQWHELDSPELKPDDLAFLQYTGGTTGVAKGAMLTHRNIIANMEQSAAWLGQNVKLGEEIIVTALPLYHIFALTANCLVFIQFGGLNYLITNPRDLKGFVGELRKVPFTAITGVNTLFNGLLNTPGFESLDFSHLHLSLGGGMAVQRKVAEHWKAVTGNTLVEAYGLTETSPAACINPLDLKEYNGAIGLPIPSTECSVQDAEGNILPSGEVGELCVRGPQVMKGYWNRPEETAKVLTEDGWLHTGDMATMDADGFFRIVDRKKDMILVSGFNVYPNEIEDVVVTHPGVLEAAAIGVPDDKSGEAVKLFVVARDAALTEADIIDFCRKELTAYKVPKQVIFRDELPKSNVGKILRKELRETG